MFSYTSRSQRCESMALTMPRIGFKSDGKGGLGPRGPEPGRAADMEPALHFCQSSGPAAGNRPTVRAARGAWNMPLSRSARAGSRMAHNRVAVWLPALCDLKVTRGAGLPAPSDILLGYPPGRHHPGIVLIPASSWQPSWHRCCGKTSNSNPGAGKAFY
jgi:hypothetical protein